VAPSVRRSTLALAVLSLLAEAPMHPYRMQQLIRERKKDSVVNVGQRASLYKAIDRLERAGLARVRETTRDRRWPERTVYELTPAGREVLREWLADALAARQREFPEFPAALSFLALLTPEEALVQLERRQVAVKADLAALEGSSRAAVAASIPRLFLVEDEYRAAVMRAELRWLARVIGDLRAGRLTWSEEWARQYSSEAGPG
jgi:DNA-binding PadR family transcriptional regulator